MLNYDSYTFLLIFIVSINICYSLDTRGVANAPPDKHTPMQLNSTHYTRKMKARRRAMLPLHRLQSCARFSTCGFSFLSLALRLFPFSLLFGVCLLFQPKLRRYTRLRSNKKSRQKEATFYPRFL